jgi:hypothetical protein
MATKPSNDWQENSASAALWALANRPIDPVFK